MRDIIIEWTNGLLGALRDVVLSSNSAISDLYIFNLNVEQVAFLCLVLITLISLFYFIYLNPLFLLGKQMFIVPISWKKIQYSYNLAKTAKALAEIDHFRFLPKMELVLYKHPQNDVVAFEIIKMGKNHFALLVPENKLSIKYDLLLSELVCPKKSVANILLFFNSSALLLSNFFSHLQTSLFQIIKKIRQKDLRSFFQVCLYIIFLPVIYTRLSTRKYFYKKLFSKMYNEEIALYLSEDINKELDVFINKPVSYFFWLVHEKN